ncbi:protein-associating with the carboxyl-terminal domain of ezrin isoform X2 [Sapajus apella]|uniref:Protein-associating with the carboxyl-terminal domain of ezrin isoform X2 n=1 Tax=Sapajus apella TaxID=9515 RepID=A0A6J3IXN6_SAPAP|nr:protein-associating with the carboxyl-terminal domain of ezrin isoform X2 [Sapajus apella]
MVWEKPRPQKIVGVVATDLPAGRVVGVNRGAKRGPEPRPSASSPAALPQHLKTLRHPCLLRFLSCTVEADGIHLVTERVQPLEVALETLSSAEVCAGIYDILLALIFLHDRGHLTHNNVCLSSVFVSEDGHWKLGGMETVCKVSQATPEFLRSIQSVRDPASIPPEEMSPEFTTLPECHGHARDAFSFGILVESLLTILNKQVSADVLSSFQQTLHSTLLNPIPKCRPALCTLLSHDFFRNDFLEVVNFLKSLTLKSEEEKTEFFKFLLDRVSCLSEELIASRLVPLLLNQLVFAEPVAVKSFLPHLLGPKKDHAQGETPCLLSPALFQSRVIPVLLQLFEVHEEHVRMVLLSHIEAYVEHFTQEQLKKVILPQVLLGLRDTSDSIVAITLHSLAVLVSLLGPEVVVGGERTKIFKRTAPSFTKNIDLSLEDSPVRVVCSQHSQISPILENPFSSIFPKCFFSGNMPINKKHIQQDYYNTLLQTGDPFSQPIKFPISGLPDVKNSSEDSENFPSSSKKSEEWPDWSEPEEPENQTVNIQIWPREPCDAVKSQCTTLDVEESSWDDCEPGSLDTKVNPGGGITATKPVTSGEQKPIPALLPFTEESTTWKSSLPGKTSLVQSRDDPDQIKSPKVSSQERPLKVPSELGLGEEFTIQVKKKPVKDPEMDWFADMIPEIKPSAAFLILPELRTEMVPNKDDVSPVMQFSSKFAAAEITEGEAEGWEEGELNWEDNNW